MKIQELFKNMNLFTRKQNPEKLQMPMHVLELGPIIGPPPCAGVLFLGERDAAWYPRKKSWDRVQKRDLTLQKRDWHFTILESNYKMDLFGSKELAYKLGMLVWEGKGDHFATVHHSNERIRREERNVIGRRSGVLSTIGWCSRPQAGSTVDDRMMLTAARRECCRL